MAVWEEFLHLSLKPLELY